MARMVNRSARTLTHRRSSFEPYNTSMSNPSSEVSPTTPLLEFQSTTDILSYVLFFFGPHRKLLIHLASWFKLLFRTPSRSWPGVYSASRRESFIHLASCHTDHFLVYCHFWISPALNFTQRLAEISTHGVLPPIPVWFMYNHTAPCFDVSRLLLHFVSGPYLSPTFPAMPLCVCRHPIYCHQVFLLIIYNCHRQFYTSLVYFFSLSRLEFHPLQDFQLNWKQALKMIIM